MSNADFAELAIEPETVVLRAGFVVALDAVRLALDLEAREISMRVETNERGGRTLVLNPKHRLTKRDLALIMEHRNELIRIVEYTPERPL